MPSSPDIMIRQLREEFETLIDFVSSSDTTKIYEVERSLFSMLLAMGAKLLGLFFALRSQALHEQAPQEAPPFHSFKSRNYLSVFGKLTYHYPYYWSRAFGGVSPLDEALDLPSHQYSDLLGQMCTALSVQIPYAKSASFFKQFFSLDLSTRVLSQQVMEQNQAVDAFYRAKAPPEEEARILVVQIDGKGVPMRRDSDGELKKKEAVVTAVYTIHPRFRTPEQVVASLFEEEKTAPGQRTHPQNKDLFATLEGKEAAFAWLSDQAHRRIGSHHHVALCDGDKALQSGIEMHFSGDSPNYTLILDLMHAMEYLWKAARAACDWTRQRSWVKERALELLQGRIDAVITCIEEASEQTKKPEQKYELEKVLTYYRRNRDRMRYDLYLECGWPIATGVIESACGHLVKDRCEGAGMRWSKSGADALLKLRSVQVNDDWEDYHHYRRNRTFKRRFGQDRDPKKPHELEVLKPGVKIDHQLI